MTTSIKLDRPVGSTAKPEVKSLHEQMMPGCTMQDLNDTMNEFYKVNEEMWGMVKDLKLEQRKELNGVIKEFCGKKE